jgi:4-hydroxy-tetrahydrodipicolinate synthase
MNLPRGVMALTYTPLKEDYSLNEDAIRTEIDWAIENGAKGIWPGGYAGQWPETDEEVRKRHLKVCIEHAKGRIFCAAGCHATNTLQTIRLANYAEQMGYDCAWISPTLPRAATAEEIYEHHRLVVEGTGIPLALYDSSPVGSYMAPDLVLRIVEMSPRFIAMKAIVSDFVHMASLYNLGIHKRISILGVEWNMLPHLLLGAPGALGGSDWIPAMCAIFEAFTGGEMDKAWDLQKAIAEQSPLLIPRVASTVMGSKIDHSGIGYLKARFSLLSGIDIGPPLPPHRPASKAEVERAKKGIEKMEARVARFQTKNIEESR